MVQIPVEVGSENGMPFKWPGLQLDAGDAFQITFNAVPQVIPGRREPIHNVARDLHVLPIPDHEPNVLVGQ